jgi:hypothetical protein
MKHILPAILIAIAAGTTPKLVAGDYVISGEQSQYNLDYSTTSALMTVPFTVTRVGTNWAMSNSGGWEFTDSNAGSR